MACGFQRKIAGLVRWLALAILVLAAVSNRSDAALLGLTSGSPDIKATSVVVNYFAGLDKFVANGVTANLDYPGGASPDFLINGDANSFKISVTINDAGIATGGTLKVYGGIPGKSIPDGTLLLQGTLATNGFGYQSSSGNFEFRFGSLTGALAADFNKYGTVGVKLNSGTIGFNTNFDFSNSATSGAATADVFAEVPEPGSLAIWSSISVGLLVLRWRRSRSLQSTARYAECGSEKICVPSHYQIGGV